MKGFHKKLLFLEIILGYVMILLAITGNMPAGENSRMVFEGFAGGGQKETDPYEKPQKKVALTFDDGPHPDYTGKLLDGLKERDVCATFFVMGKQAEAYPELIKRMEDEGHLIGNHTYSHLQLTKTNRGAFQEELKKTSEIVKGITGKELQYVRPPYGSWDKAFETELNMFPVLWTVDPQDWCRSDVSSIVRSVVGKVEENDIILMHDQYDSSVQAALLIVDELKKQGYEFVTVDQILLD